MKSKLKKAIRRVGYDLRRCEPDLMDFLRSRQIDTVLDVGANIGQFGCKLRAAGYTGRIISFEPIEAVFQTLKSVADRDGNWTVHHTALGHTRGLQKIKISESSVFSSLLEQTSAAQRYDLAARVLREETIDVDLLDNLSAEFRSSRVFLKIDTQGFEREVLSGATESLGGILGIQAELPIMHLYKGVWSFSEALDYFSERGFILSQVCPANYDKEDEASLLELDCIFRRNDSK